MNLKLRVVHGKLQNRHGNDAGMTVSVRSSSFVIGSGADANMRCSSSSVSDYHCELLLDKDRGTASLRDLGSETGTFVNSDRIEEVTDLRHGDRLRIGRLEFEIVFERSPFDRIIKAEDPVSNYVAEMLAQDDEQARRERLHDPQAREFHLEARAGAKEPLKEVEEKPKKRQRPPKKPPGKLPPPPPITGETTVAAAEATLKKIFERE